jgi:BirA family biotin operon repressor/biotin-[acetyl-CoA-carboxylase] ligase
MTNIEMPRLLNQIARAGGAGLPSAEVDREGTEIQLCREWGLAVEESSGRLRLAFDADSLVPAWIEAETPAIIWDQLTVAGFFRVDSTNEEALARARLGAPEGLLVIAETQTAGRGRKGREWISARGGLYFSLVLRPQQPMRLWPILTHVASSAVSRTLQDLHRLGIIPASLNVDLKWPNDVLLSGKKAAGILLETAQTGGSGPAAIIGIGINIDPGCLPTHLRTPATALNAEAGGSVARRQLLVLLLTNLQHGLARFGRGDHQTILDEWKQYSSMWNGTPIWVSDGAAPYAAVTCGLSEIGALKIKTADGIAKTLMAGDVSIRQI